jgi:ankyrin repeat protein
LVFWKTNSPALHIILLIAVIIPAALLAWQWIRGPLMDRDIAVGGYIYNDPKLKKFVSAVAKLDQQKVRELAPGVDVNAVGQLDTTPLKFAIDNLDNGDAPARLDMIRLLLTLGAKPDSALQNACRLGRSDATGILLDAGANPSYKDKEGTPVFFYCPGNSGGLECLRLLAAKGADFNSLDAEGAGALINAATFSRWDTMLYFLDQGVKDTATRNGKNAAAMVRQAIEDDKQNSRETVPALRQLHAKLNN